MKLLYFVKDGCDACKKAREKVEFFLGRWGVADGVERETVNCSTADGLVEASMREVHDVPSVVIEEGGEEVARWIRRPPTSAELRQVLGLAGADAGADAGPEEPPQDGVPSPAENPMHRD